MDEIKTVESGGIGAGLASIFDDDDLDVFNIQDDSETSESEDSESIETDESMSEDLTDLDEYVGEEESVTEQLRVNKYNRLEFLYVKIASVDVPKDYISQNPQANIQGLAQEIREFGLLDPIKILTGEVDGSYILVDGLRRIMVYRDQFKKDTIAAVIIGDSTKLAKKFGDDFLRFKLAHRKGFTVKDKYDLIDKVTRKGKVVLDDYEIAELEALLELNPGDYEKMLDLRRDASSPEAVNREKPCKIYENLIQGKTKSESEISAAFKKLEARRKKDAKDAEERGASDESGYASEASEDGLGQVDTAEGELGSEKKGKDKAGKAPVEMPTNADDLAKMLDSGQINNHNKQDRKTDNDHLDPALRKAVLARDNNSCQCCGIGEEAPEVFGGTFEVHHIKPVYLGGLDRIDNLITLCKNCHALIHALERGQLFFPSGTDFKRLSSEMQERLLRVNHYGGMVVKNKQGHAFPKNLFYGESQEESEGLGVEGVVDRDIEASIDSEGSDEAGDDYVGTDEPDTSDEDDDVGYEDDNTFGDW